MGETGFPARMGAHKAGWGFRGNKDSAAVMGIQVTDETQVAGTGVWAANMGFIAREEFQVGVR